MNERRHTRPDRHRRKPGVDCTLRRLLLTFLGVAAAFLAVILAAELICTALGCPADPWALR